MPIQLSLKDDCPEMIAQRAQGALRVISDFYDMFSEDIQEAAKLLALAFSGEQRLFVAGLGLSSCLADMLARRLVHGKAPDRSPLPVQALNCHSVLSEDDPADTDRNLVFARQIEAFGSDGDILILITQDGAHPALQEAATAAHEQGMFTVGFTGGDGGALAQNDLLDLELRVPSIEEALIHEVHMNLICLLDDLIDYYLSSKPEILNEMLQAGVSRLRDDLNAD